MHGEQASQRQGVLAPKKLVVEDLLSVEALLKTLLDFIGAKEHGVVGTCDPFVELASSMSAKHLGVQRVVRRSCYNHILPIVKHAMRNKRNSCITGTPGIGKTLFGLFLLRDIIINDESTVTYWNSDFAVLFTVDPDVIIRYDLSHTEEINEKQWYIGCWSANEEFLTDLLAHDKIYVVHDPKEGFIEGGNKAYTTGTAFILSFGHALISSWSTKRTGSPDVSLSMPYFPLLEIVNNKNNLFYGKQVLISDDGIKQLYRKFGGSIRHYWTTTEKRAWEELRAKIVDVASTGKAISTRTTDHKGSVVHVWVDYDPNKPIFPITGFNTFSSQEFMLGSEELVLQYSTALAAVGREQLNSIMNAVNGQVGAEAVYGALFEIHAHNVLLEGNRSFNVRVVRRDGKQKDLCATTTIPVNSEMHIFHGREAIGISETLVQGTKLSVGTYIKPAVSNFPTYDSALVVPGANVGLKDDNVGLLLQMTVSGASGLRRRPKHSVKHYMRKEMGKVLRETCESSVPLSVTTFCVPSACFHPFDYQPELRKDTEVLVVDQNQADYQFVVEIPGFTPLPITETEPVGIHGKTGRAHSFTLRERCKKAKIEDLP